MSAWHVVCTGLDVWVDALRNQRKVYVGIVVGEEQDGLVTGEGDRR